MQICFYLIGTFLLSNNILFAQPGKTQLKFAEEQKLAEASFRGAAIAHNVAFIGSQATVYKATLNEFPLKWH